MHSPRRRWLSPAVPLLFALAGMAGVVALVPPSNLARAADPRLTAGYQTTEDLAVAIDLPAAEGDRPALAVELLGRDGKLLESKALKTPGRDAGTVRVTFAPPKEKLDHLEVRVLSGGRQTSRVKLASILLTRAHETTVSTSSELFAGSRAALRCGVHGVKSYTETIPLPRSEVVVTLHDGDKDRVLFNGRTDDAGVADVSFTVPDLKGGTYKMTVRTKSALGEEKLERMVNVQAAPKILLTTDKPIYQPGQTIHVRALALRAFDLAPARGDVLFEIEDGKGNKVFKRTAAGSDYGVSSIDFTLADEVNRGDYRIRATQGDVTSEKTVAVKRYVLPKFKTEVKAERSFYLPKEVIEGKIQADYVFGKPVAGGTVEVKASTFDVAFKEFAKVTGKADKYGTFEYKITLPDYFVGTPLAKGDAIVKIDVKVTDTADHSETVSRTFPVSDQPIRVSLIPEAGKLVPGVSNRIYAAALYPDGSPAKGTAVDFYVGNKAQGKPVATAKTNDAGLAEISLTPKDDQFTTGGWGQVNVELLGGVQQRWMPSTHFALAVEAKDAKGNKASRVESLTSEPLGENVLLRLNKAIFKGGDVVEAEVLSSAGTPTVYVDVVKSGQILSSRWVDVKGGVAKTKFDLPANMFGTLEVHAYTVLSTSEIVRDSRVVYVSPADELKIRVSADKKVYRPGEEGTIRFEVTDKAGRPTAAALGVIVVDEAVYALQEMQPGLERVYFTLQKELTTPKVQSDYRPRETVDGLVNQPGLGADEQQVARVLLTAAQPKPPARWAVEPAEARKQAMRQRVDQMGQAIGNWAMANHAVVTKDEKSGKMAFAAGLFDQMAKAHQVHPDWAKDPFGQPLKLEALAKVDPNFTPERLAEAVSKVRLVDLAHQLNAYVGENVKKLKDGEKWSLPKTLLADAAQRHGGKHNLSDAWGKPVELRARAKGEKNDFGGNHSFFDAYTLVSAGPDGTFGTADDVAMSGARTRWEYGLAWWYTANTRDGRKENLAHMRFRGVRRGGDDREMFFLERAEMKRDGGPLPPMAAPGLGGGGIVEATAALGQKAGAKKGGGGAPPARLREYFPETMLWQPSLITDDQGKAALKVNFADSITTWRLSASGSSRTGQLGGVNAPVRVFQDFFVDLNLPVALTQNDEVTFPVAVYNYLTSPQTVTLELKPDAGYELLEGENKRQVSLKAEEVTSVKFKVKAKKVGALALHIDARGSKMSDAVRRSIDVLPDGKAAEQVFSDRLDGTVKHKVNVPDDAIEGASRLFVRVYPGVVSQVIEGMEGVLRMPHGCFEQTSSSAYPNVLVVDYLKKSKTGSPATLLKAETYLSAGYQRLLTFERPGGGFDWWGSGEPLVWLSAYGLQEFNDMAKVWPVDRGVVERTQKFLMSKQDKDGTWSKIGATHGESIERMGDPKLLLTAYVAWSILDSTPRTEAFRKSDDYKKLAKSIEFIRKEAPKAKNAYILALCANALASWDATDDATFAVLRQVLTALSEKKEQNREWNAISYPAGGQSLSYGRGDSMTVETTALAILAMVKSGQFTNEVNQALTYLIKTKGGHGHWGSTQATILAIKALIAGSGAGEHKGETPYEVRVNGKRAGGGVVTKDNADVTVQLDLREHLKAGDNEVSIETKGKTSLTYQVVCRNFVPHPKEVKGQKEAFDLSVEYDRTKLSTKDVLKATATMKYNGKTPTYNVIVDLPIPPGFSTDAGEFAEWVKAKKVEKFSVTARQVTLYLGDVKAGDEHVFEYVLKPRFAIKAKTPAAVTYEYYTPTNRAATKPVELVVEEAK